MKWKKSFLILFLATIVGCGHCNFFSSEPTDEANVEQAQVLQELRKRWGAADIVRDINHIKEDMQRITKLQDAGDISSNEALFYFLRMHDFDENGKLDGHELIAAMKHSVEHDPTFSMPFSEIEKIVDSFFAYDDNNDGYVSYPELRKHL